LDRRIRFHASSRNILDEKRETLCEEWHGSAAFFNSLIQSMPRRVSAVIASNGTGTKY